jgi:hypothetical protein
MDCRVWIPGRLGYGGTGTPLKSSWRKPYRVVRACLPIRDTLISAFSELEK